jgi:hypothetical protein
MTTAIHLYWLVPLGRENFCNRKIATTATKVRDGTGTTDSRQQLSAASQHTGFTVVDLDYSSAMYSVI